MADHSLKLDRWLQFLGIKGDDVPPVNRSLQPVLLVGDTRGAAQTIRTRIGARVFGGGVDNIVALNKWAMAQIFGGGSGCVIRKLLVNFEDLTHAATQVQLETGTTAATFDSAGTLNFFQEHPDLVAILPTFGQIDTANLPPAVGVGAAFEWHVTPTAGPNASVISDIYIPPATFLYALLNQVQPGLVHFAVEVEYFTEMGPE